MEGTGREVEKSPYCVDDVLNTIARWIVSLESPPRIHALSSHDGHPLSFCDTNSSSRTPALIIVCDH